MECIHLAQDKVQWRAKILCAFIVLPLRATCTVSLILLDLT